MKPKSFIICCFPSNIFTVFILFLQNFLIASPRFGIAHALCLGLAPWLAAEVPILVDSGVLNTKMTKPLQLNLDGLLLMAVITLVKIELLKVMDTSAYMYYQPPES